MADKTYIQEFEIKDGQLHIRATSGNSYVIHENHCSCKGFGFRRDCGHYREAVEKDLLSLLVEERKLQKSSLTMSPQAVQSRKKAILRYLTLHAIKSSQSMIDELEKVVTSQMKPEEFLKIAAKLVRSLDRK